MTHLVAICHKSFINSRRSTDYGYFFKTKSDWFSKTTSISNILFFKWKSKRWRPPSCIVWWHSYGKYYPWFVDRGFNITLGPSSMAEKQLSHWTGPSNITKEAFQESSRCEETNLKSYHITFKQKKLLECRNLTQHLCTLGTSKFAKFDQILQEEWDKFLQQIMSSFDGPQFCPFRVQYWRIIILIELKCGEALWMKTICKYTILRTA